MVFVKDVNNQLSAVTVLIVSARYLQKKCNWHAYTFKLIGIFRTKAFNVRKFLNQNFSEMFIAHLNDARH